MSLWILLPLVRAFLSLCVLVATLSYLPSGNDSPLVNANTDDLPDATVTDVFGSTPNESQDFLLQTRAPSKWFDVLVQWDAPRSCRPSFLDDTSYTGPCILHVKVGPAWVALKHSKVGSRKRRPEWSADEEGSYWYTPHPIPKLPNPGDECKSQTISQRPGPSQQSPLQESKKELPKLSAKASNWPSVRLSSLNEHFGVVLKLVEVSRRILWTNKEVPLEDSTATTTTSTPISYSVTNVPRLFAVSCRSLTPVLTNAHKFQPDRTAVPITSLLAYSGLLY
ncbi:hypothetical protein EDB87DRAFT_1700215 [Lactarius vividus]|nr:hypothetical protein EDB87DRAFT_1700215 [Lactarius vividus]